MVPASAAESTLEQGRRLLLGHFASLGYFERPPLDLITLDDFNDGLRYDRAIGSSRGGNVMWPQLCGRVEDIANKGQEGVLAGFHHFALRNSNPAFDGELLLQAVGFLVRQAGLPPSRLVFVSTEWFEPYKSIFGSHGIAMDQLIVRPLAEAEAAGDGSGFFKPDGHPMKPRLATVSIHFVTDDGPAGGRSYPLSGAIEIAELTLRAGPRRDAVVQDGSFGLERLLMAQGKAVGDFEESRRRLLRAIEQEAARRGVPLPEAHGTFAAA